MIQQAAQNVDSLQMWFNQIGHDYLFIVAAGIAQYHDNDSYAPNIERGGGFLSAL